MNERKSVLWEAAPEGYGCCWTSDRTGKTCEKVAIYAERRLKALTVREFVPRGRTGRGYCKRHWGMRNAKR